MVLPLRPALYYITWKGKCVTNLLSTIPTRTSLVEIVNEAWTRHNSYWQARCSLDCFNPSERAWNEQNAYWFPTVPDWPASRIKVRQGKAMDTFLVSIEEPSGALPEQVEPVVTTVLSIEEPSGYVPEQVEPAVTTVSSSRAEKSVHEMVNEILTQGYCEIHLGFVQLMFNPQLQHTEVYHCMYWDDTMQAEVDKYSLIRNA